MFQLLLTFMLHRASEVYVKFSIWKRLLSICSKFSHHSFQQKARKALGGWYYVSKIASFVQKWNILPDGNTTTLLFFSCNTLTFQEKLPHIATLVSPLHYNYPVSRDITNYDLLILKERRCWQRAKCDSTASKKSKE